MSLFGALQLGSASLAAQQTGLQVTGNNISNAGTPGYTRETAHLVATDPTQIGTNQFGNGAGVMSIDRQANDALDASLRTANTDQAGSQTAADTMSQIENTFGALNSNDLSARMSSFFNSFSSLANNPNDAGQRAVVIQNGVSLANYVQSLRTQLTDIRTSVQTNVQQLAGQANTLVQGIATLNGQIVSAEANGGQANTLRDQRDQQLTALSKLIDVRTIQQPNGQFNVLSGSVPLIEGTLAHPIGTQTVPNPNADPNNPNALSNLPVTQLIFTDSRSIVPASGGQIPALIQVQNQQLDPAVLTLDTYARSLITSVNGIHSQGQGLTDFSAVTGATTVTDPNAALNAGPVATGLPVPPVNGTFMLNVRDTTTGQITSRQITVNLSGNGTQTTLTNLAAQINGGNIAASVDGNNHLVIKSTNANTTFNFSDDTSGALAALGVNTFFTGKDAGDIGVNQTIVATPSLLATGRGNVIGSNGNAQALALAYTASDGTLGNQSLKDFYAKFIGNLAASTKTAKDDAAAKQTVQQSISAQREAFSGVSLDEEAINLTKYQRAFQGTARFVTAVDDMMQVVLGMIH